MIAPTALLALALAQEAPSVDLVHHCLPEETATRTISGRYEIALTGTRTTVDGEEQPSRNTADYRTSGAVELRFVERVEACAGGRAIRLVRRFDTVDSERSEKVGARDGGEGEEQRWREESMLAGEGVRFERDGSKWRSSWADPEHAGSPPRGLAAELDFGSLAPDRPVAIGDQWEVAPRAAQVMLRPWIGMPFHVAGEAPAEQGETDDPPQIRGLLRVRLEAVDEGPSGRVARFALEVDLVEGRDLTEQARAESAASELPAGAARPVIDSMTDESTYRGTGSASWDVERGRLLALDLACDSRQLQSVRTRITLGKRQGALERTTTLDGKLSLSVRTLD